MAMEEKEFQTYKKRAFEFIWEELDPIALEIEKTGHIPRKELWPKFRDMGFLAMNVPKEYGGMGLSEVQYLEFEKEWAKVHGGIRILLHCVNTSADFLKFARKEQQEKYWPKVARGEVAFAFALTEPNAGSGKDIKTIAQRDGENFRITGVKHLISNTDFCDLYNVVCKTSGGPDDPQYVFLIVDKESDGFIIKAMERCMGCTGSYHERVIFDNCLVPKENVIGEEVKGLEYALSELNTSRVRISSNALGVMERCLDLSIEYAKKRVTFGKPIAQRQIVQDYLSETAMAIYALQGMINDTARKIDKGENTTLEANLCKLFATEGARRATDNAMLIFGGIGYTAEYPIQRLYRDVRLNWLEEATPSIPMITAARALVEGRRTYRAFHEERVETSFEKTLKNLSPDLASRLRAL